MVCDTITTTVPKAVVHCLVRKAEKNLLSHLFAHVHTMAREALDCMLQARPQGAGARVAAGLCPSDGAGAAAALPIAS
jgi:hypothetical protein